MLKDIHYLDHDLVEGELHLEPNLVCFVRYLKIINTYAVYLRNSKLALKF